MLMTEVSDMEDPEYLIRIKDKIERLTSQSIHLHLDEENASQIKVSWCQDGIEVLLGSDALQHPGFARTAIEYAVGCINQKRELGQLEFKTLLSRN